MTNISAGAAANREHAREANGQFGNQHHSAPIAMRPTPIRSDVDPDVRRRVDKIGAAARKRAVAIGAEYRRLQQISHRANASSLVMEMRAMAVPPHTITFQEYVDGAYRGVAFREVTGNFTREQEAIANDFGEDFALDTDFDDVSWFQEYETVTYDFTDPTRITVRGGWGDQGCYNLDTWPVDNPAAGLEPTEQDT